MPCRLDLNDPPTSVGGIREFGSGCLVGWTPSRQILKLCEAYFPDGDPPDPDAHYYSDIRVLLAALDPLSWKGYAGAYLYAMFKNRLRRREEMRKNQR